MSRNKALCSVLAGLVVLAAMPACKPSPLEGYVVARVSGIAVPDYDVSQSELEAHPGSIPFNIHLIVDPTVNTDEMVGGDSSGDSFGWGPVVVPYGFGSDGVCFKEEVLLGMEVPPPNPGAEIELADGGDGAWSAYECLTQITPGETDAAAGDRVWLRQFTLDIATSKSLVSRLGSGLLELDEDGPYFGPTDSGQEEAPPLSAATLTDDEAIGPSAEIPLYVNEALLTWELDPDADPDFFYVPLAMIAIIGLEPEGFKPYTEIAPPDGMIQVTPPSLDPEEIVENVKTMIMEAELGPQIVLEADSGSAEDIWTFELVDPTLVEISIYDFEDSFFAPVPLDAPAEPSGDPPPHMYNGYSGGTVEATGEADPGVALLESFQWGGEPIEGLIVHNFPVSGELLFTPDEPHVIELPYTFWLSLLPGGAAEEDEPIGQLAPEDSGESAPPQDDEPAPESFLAVSIEPVSETIEDESGCRSILTIGYGAVDLTGGGRPVSDVSLRVDGEELYPWSGTPTDHYQDSALLESGCSEVHVVEVAASNADGQTVTATREVRVPPLSTHFTYGILDVPGEGECRMQLFIEYEAVDLTTPGSPVTNVVVKANGSVWRDSGAINTDRYADSFRREVGCGQTYLIEVTGTDTDGSTYTYRETVNIPVPTPPEPPPPQTTLYAAYAASAQCMASGPECSCSLSISFDGKDLTGGDYPVTSVVLRVNGQLWHDSGSVSTTQYHQTEQRTVNCGETFNMVLTVNNSIGQTATSTGSLTTPVP